MDTKKVLTDEELDKVTGGNELEINHLRRLYGTTDIKRWTKLAAAAFGVDESQVSIVFHSDDFWHNEYKINGYGQGHDNFVSVINKYLEKHPEGWDILRGNTK